MQWALSCAQLRYCFICTHWLWFPLQWLLFHGSRSQFPSAWTDLYQDGFSVHISLSLLIVSAISCLDFYFLGWSKTESTITEVTTGLLYQPWMMTDDDECGAISGMIGRETQSTHRKLAPVLLCPPHIPHDLTWARTWAAAVGSQRLTIWAMVQPFAWLTLSHISIMFLQTSDSLTVLQPQRYTLHSHHCWELHGQHRKSFSSYSLFRWEHSKPQSELYMKWILTVQALPNKFT
jgi:hypothetical protein